MAAAAIAVGMTLAGSANADMESDVRICLQNLPRTTGGGQCMRAIESGQFHGQELRDLHFAAGTTYLGRGDMTPADIEFTVVVTLDPSYVPGYLHRGIVHLREADTDLALKDFGTVLRLDRDSAAGLYGRGLTKLKFGDSSGNADLAAARSADKDVGALFTKFGIEQPPPPPPPPPIASAPVTPAAAPAPAAKADAQPDPCAFAATHWRSTESIHTLEAYRDHLARFPTCTFAGLARAQIAALSKPEPAPPAAHKPAAKTQRARARVQPAPDERPSGQLDCSRPGQWAACANRALSTVPGSD
jgi:hypothetical protein